MGNGSNLLVKDGGIRGVVIKLTGLTNLEVKDEEIKADCGVMLKELSDKALDVYSKLSKKFNVEYDEGGSIGKRYRRQDEIGTPFCITIDFDTLEDETVTLRNRDTMEQERIKIDDLEAYIEKSLEF